MATPEKESNIAFPSPSRLAEDLIAEFASANSDLQNAIQTDDRAAVAKHDKRIAEIIEHMMNSDGFDVDSRLKLYRFLFENVISLEIDNGSFTERLLAQLLDDLEVSQHGNGSEMITIVDTKKSA